MDLKNNLTLYILKFCRKTNIFWISDNENFLGNKQTINFFHKNWKSMKQMQKMKGIIVEIG